MRVDVLCVSTLPLIQIYKTLTTNRRSAGSVCYHGDGAERGGGWILSCQNIAQGACVCPCACVCVCLGFIFLLCFISVVLIFQKGSREPFEVVKDSVMVNTTETLDPS